jgi:lipid-binding SYLF domain-containing protein
MKKALTALIGILVLGLPALGFSAEVEDYSNTINTFKKSPAVEKFFNDSYGYAVFPAIGKAGFVIGGSYGEGQVYRGGIVTGKTSVIEGSIGFQFGGKAFSQIIFFQDKRAYDEFTSGSFEFDATAQAIVVTVGAEAQAGTTGATAGASATPSEAVQADAEYINGMATFAHAKGGLMYELSIGGQKFSFEPI